MVTERTFKTTVRMLDKAHPQELGGFCQGLDYILTVSRAIEVWREYRLPLVLTFVGYFRKACDSVKTNATLSPLVDQAFPPAANHAYWQGVRQGDTILPKLFTATLQWIRKSLSWKEEGIRVDGRLPLQSSFCGRHRSLLEFFSNEAETMINELKEARKRIGLRINRRKTQFMKNAHCKDGGVHPESSQIVETSSYAYRGRSTNMENVLKEELNRRMGAAWARFAPIREADQLTDQDLRAHLFDSTVLPAFRHAAET
ncbi:hypothetical protein RB195_000891 [Necator americanus]|uniref:Reverse transcriptase domain-containing protein n=1 Tax=Necator americanus TaxID=51031 RepID=A0ABR1DD41_NECAM